MSNVKKKTLPILMNEISKHQFIKNKKGHVNEYVTLDMMLSTIASYLGDHGYSVLQKINGNSSYNKELFLETVIVKEDEEGKVEEILSSGKFNFGSFITEQELTSQGKKALHEMQWVGVHITYARRYQLAAFFGINCEEDLDSINAKEAEKLDKVQKLKDIVAGTEHESKVLTQLQIEKSSAELDKFIAFYQKKVEEDKKGGK